MKLSDRIKSKFTKVNLTSIAFFAVSIMSITLAWFAYTNTVTSNMNVNLKTWDIKITKNNTEVSNVFDITINNLSPGMTDFQEDYVIHNNGDIPAKITYNIKYFRLFNTEVTTTNGISFAQLARDYPFKLEFTHGSRYLAADSTSNFGVSCTWPFDSGNDKLDTQYGQMAYNFYQSEQQLHNQNSSYQIRSGLELKIEIVVSQYVDNTVSFANDSWDTIELAVEKGDTSKYHVGDTKSIVMHYNNNDYTHVLRLANKTTPSSCSNSTYSQTACGFVVEFADILSYSFYMDDYLGNEGGYPDSFVKQEVDSFEKYFPIELQNVISKTRVVSGHGSLDSTNFVSTEKLYLLSGKEIYGSDSYDTAASTTRKLDYYSNKGVTLSNNLSFVQKREYGSNVSREWWVRTANKNDSDTFLCVNRNGTYSPYAASNTYFQGVSPAFRIT